LFRQHVGELSWCAADFALLACAGNSLPSFW
jgi:hypothetical protein